MLQDNETVVDSEKQNSINLSQSDSIPYYVYQGTISKQDKYLI